VYYEKVLPPDTISIMRMGHPAYYFYVYRLKNLQAKRWFLECQNFCWLVKLKTPAQML